MFCVSEEVVWRRSRQRKKASFRKQIWGKRATTWLEAVPLEKPLLGVYFVTQTGNGICIRFLFGCKSHRCFEKWVFPFLYIIS